MKRSLLLLAVSGALSMASPAFAHGGWRHGGGHYHGGGGDFAEYLRSCIVGKNSDVSPEPGTVSLAVFVAGGTGGHLYPGIAIAASDRLSVALMADGTVVRWGTTFSGAVPFPTGLSGVSANVAQMKHVYRRGLGLRYGRIMQAISGVHFNYSFPSHFWEVWSEVCEHKEGASQDFISASYFDVLRNYRRHGWIVPYLFYSHLT